MRHRLTIGSHVCVHAGSISFEDDHGSVRIGARTTIYQASLGNTEGGRIEVGEDCLLASEVDVRNGDSHSIVDVAAGARLNPAADVTIGDHVWIGLRVMVLKGSHIGARCVVGAGSIVSGVIPEGSVAAGSPARVMAPGRRGAGNGSDAQPARHLRRSAIVPLALIAAYAALGLSWSMANAPFTAPDETQHYLRALAIRTDRALAGPRIAYTGPILSPKETAWRRKLTRAATVPPRMSPAGLDCVVFRLDATPTCADRVVPNDRTKVEDTDVGSYAPLPYVLPAIATAFGDDATSAARSGRLASLMLWLAFIAAAVWMLWDRRAGGVSLVGLVVAITPTAVFLGSSLNNSSLEIAASVAFFSALVRLSRDEQENRAAWALAAVSGSALVLSRSLGVVWMGCALIICAVLLGGAGTRALLSRSRRAATLAAGALVMAVALTAAWEVGYGPRVGATPLTSPSALYDGAFQLRYALEALIGRFGYEDVRLGTAGLVVWAAMASVLVGVAARVGAKRDRRALLIALALAIFVPIYLHAAVTRHQGIVTQGRHLLPLAVIVALLCGEILRRRLADGLPVRSALLFGAVGLAGAGVQLLAWWVNAHRYAVGVDGPWWFLSEARWSPPGGWAVWALLAASGALLLVVAAASDLLRGRREALRA